MKKHLSIAMTLLFALLLLLYPTQAAAAVRDGLLLCANTVIPSLFPFFVVVSLLGQLGFAVWLQRIFAPLMGPLFRMQGVCAMPLLAGLLGGYPAGAKAAAELYDQNLLTRQDAELLLGFCNNCGPAFLLGYVGAGVLGSSALGVRLVVVHVASALLTGMLLCRIHCRRGPMALPCRQPAVAVPLSRSLTTAVTGSVTSMLHICAFVVVFRTAASLLPTQLPVWAMGAVEMVGGIAALPGSGMDFILAAGITAWGGLSVHCQTMAVTGDLSLKWHWLGKMIQTAIALLLAAALT